MSAPDPLFEAYVRASEAESAAALQRLVEAAQPAIREVCTASLGFAHVEVEDARAEALMRVVCRAQQLRDEADGGDGIQNVAAYAAVTARRVCADVLRRTHPVRARLACRVRYALTHDPALRVRRLDAGIVHAGLAGWSDALAAVPAAKVSDIAASIRVDVAGAALLGTLRDLLTRAGAWIETGVLISTLFDAAALRDPSFTPVEDVDPVAPAAEAPPDARESRGRLRAVWNEIVSLPPRQRAALLLHLRDHDGRSGLALFVVTGVATLAALADALELRAADLAELWPSLPLDDLRIGERLSATRQQVINLRKSARARLGRRLARSSPSLVIPAAFGRHTIREHS